MLRKASNWTVGMVAGAVVLAVLFATVPQESLGSSWKLLTATYDGTNFDHVRIDPSTNSLQVVDYEHHEVHAGSHFSYSEYDGDLDAAAVLEILITTPNTTEWAHMVVSVDGQLETLVEFFEGSTHTAGAAKTAYNSNRNSATTNTTTLAVSNDDGSDGTAIFSTLFGIETGGGSNKVAAGGGTRGSKEWVLDQNNKYLLRVTSNSANNVVGVALVWYQHTAKH